MRIIYIDIDSCRPDHFGCYGYHRNTSPNLDCIADEGTRFEKVYVSDAGAKKAIPRSQDGFPVVVEVSGRFKAL